MVLTFKILVSIGNRNEVPYLAAPATSTYGTTNEKVGPTVTVLLDPLLRRDQRRGECCFTVVFPFSNGHSLIGFTTSTRTAGGV